MTVSTETKPKAVIAPEGCGDYLTPGKRYEIEEWDGFCFLVRSDDGEEVWGLLKGCAHLAGRGDWIVPTEDAA